MGIIQLLDQSLFLQPLTSHFVSDSNPKVNSHLIYRRSLDDKTTENQYKGIQMVKMGLCVMFGIKHADNLQIST